MANYLLNEQKELAEKIQQLLSNTKKEPLSRRNKEHLEKKLSELQCFWTEFEKNDDVIRTKEPDLSGRYFTDEIYNTTKINYEEALVVLDKFLKAALPSTAENDKETVINIGKRIKFRINQLSKYTTVVNESLNETQAMAYYEQALTKFHQMIEEMQVMIEDLIVLTDETHETQIKEIIDQIDEVNGYSHITIKALQKIVEKPAIEGKIQNKDDGAVKQKPPKLPPIALGKFNGDYRKWTAFKNLFVSVIHENVTLSAVEKLRYLQTHLEGEPSKLISHLQLTNDNYEAAFKLITERYDNKRKISDMYLDILLDLSPATAKSASSIRILHDSVRECIEGLKALNSTFSDSPILTRIIIKKLDPESLKSFEEGLTNPKESPTLQTLLTFLESRFLVLEAIAEKRNSNPKQGCYSSHIIQSVKKCSFCQKGHRLINCSKFEQLTPKARLTFVNRKKICINCLSHNAKEKCFSKYVCFICQKRHHTMLHVKSENISKLETTNQPVPSTSSNQATQQLTTNHVTQKTTVLLSTAMVRIKSIRGQFEQFRALIDQGSQASLITEKAAQILGLPRTTSNVEVSGLGAENSKKAKHKIQVEIFPHFSNSSEFYVTMHVLPKITGNLPSEPIQNNRAKWNNILLADPNYDTPGKIDILLGADVYSDIIVTGIQKGYPTAIKTKLGWILNGKTTTDNVCSNLLLSHISIAEIHDSISKLWTIEEINPQNNNLTNSSEVHYKNNTRRLKDGTYEVRLPFKKDKADLGESKKQALARFFQIEKSLEHDHQKQKQYHQFMNEYLQLNHMKPIKNINSKDGYYLPHHGVWKEDSLTTKLRVVFDASAVTTNGKSLNDELLIGPTIQENLTSILTRWRTHKYVFTADIEKMYRQIKVSEDDQKFQKILWRFSKYEAIQEYALTTVTYGTASAPYLAIRTLHQLANDEYNSDNKEIIRIIKEDFYVDDLLSGANDLQTAKLYIQKINQIMKKGGLTLRKWNSNETSLLENLSEDLKISTLVEINKDDTIKTLGIWWNAKSDEFTYKIHLNIAERKTKRIFLSNMSKLFDPMGWLAPITINAKLMIQELWLAGYDWDDILPESFTLRWDKLEKNLHLLENVRISRSLKMETKYNLEIHGFCDASEKAYAAVVYARVSTKDGCRITLLGAKTKVAPLNKEQTIPRLELCGAVLLSNFINQIIKSFNFKSTTPTYYWTDSKIALAWIKGQPQRWKSFVAHRVAEINKQTCNNQWMYVNTKENPADLASRGISPAQIINNQLWWHGPNWLKENWCEEINNLLFETNEESTQKIKEKVTTLCAKTDSTSIISRFSSLGKLIRVTAYLKRFKNKNKGNLTTLELNEALQCLIKLIQHEAYKEDTQLLRSGQGNKIQNKLLQLNPFIDSNNVLRVGGRLKQLNSTIMEKHPIILPASHHFSKLLVEHAHKQTLHGGNQLTLSYVRQNYWIPNGKCLTRKVIHSCVVCHRFKAESAKQLMGNLPKVRITPAPAFTNTGIDYAGPINLRVSKGRGNKSYKGFISVFVCMVTKAIHLEAVSDLTTEAFMAAYKRFISRRGHCLNIYSDNGTTFVGASKKLDKDFKSCITLINTEAAKQVIESKTNWHFIPPRAPHFGGLWEAAVKSMKYHLKRVIGDQTLTFEEITTVLCQIEACLNSRPISPLSNDPSDLEVLTPGHFLIGRPIIANPEPDIPGTTFKIRWNMLTKMAQDFWKQWSSEYLSQLQHRRKWMKEKSNLQIGDLVLIKDENQPIAKWSMARVSEIHPGTDNLVRAVTLKGPNNSTLKRPITKLCPMPKDSNINEQETEKITNLSITNEAVSNYTSTARDWMRGQKTNKAQEFANELKEKCKPKANKRKGGKIRPYTGSKILLLTVSILSCFFQPAFTITSSSNSEINSAQFQINQFAHQPGIYFEELGNMRFQRNEWNLIVHYNLKIYKDIIQQLQDTMDHIKETCHYSDSICNSIYLECQYLMFNIKTSDTVLQNSNKDYQVQEHRIQKRGLINGIGYLANELFGILDARSAAKYEAEIIELQSNQGYLVKLAKNHTSITDATLQLFSENTEFIKQELRFLNETIQREISRHAYTNIVLKMVITMIRIQELQGKMLDIILDTHHGKFNPILLPPDNLAKELKTIRNHIPANVIIPDIIDGNLADLYNLMTVKSRLTENHIIFSVKIPLPDIELHETFKLIPLPISYQNELLLITPSSEYLIINTHRDHFYPINTNELNLCSQMADGTRICKPNNPIYGIQSNKSKCEVALINHKDDYFQFCTMHLHSRTSNWIQLSKPNSWIYAMDDEYPIDIVCNSRVINSTTIKGQGIIHLNSGCLLKQTGLTIAARNTITSNMDTNFFPLVNSEKVFKSKKKDDIKGLRISSADVQNKLKSLQETIKQQQAAEEVNNLMHNHDVHHYAFSILCFILSTGIITAFYFIIIQRNNIQRIMSIIQTSTSTSRVMNESPV